MIHVVEPGACSYPFYALYTGLRVEGVLLYVYSIRGRIGVFILS